MKFNELAELSVSLLLLFLAWSSAHDALEVWEAGFTNRGERLKVGVGEEMAGEGDGEGVSLGEFFSLTPPTCRLGLALTMCIGLIACFPSKSSS